MGALNEKIIEATELVERGLVPSVRYISKNIPDSELPRVKRNGKICRPLRFYERHVNRVFPVEELPEQQPRSLKTELQRYKKPAYDFRSFGFKRKGK